MPVDSNLRHWNGKMFSNVKQIDIKRPGQQCRQSTNKQFQYNCETTIALQWNTTTPVLFFSGVIKASPGAQGDCCSKIFTVFTGWIVDIILVTHPRQR